MWKTHPYPKLCTLTLGKTKLESTHFFIDHSDLLACYLQVASLAKLALLLATIGGSDMSLQYIFVIYVGMHQSNYGLSEW